MRSKGLLALFLMSVMVFGVIPALAGADAEGLKTYYGPPSRMGGDSIKTYVTLDRNKVPVAIGVEIPAKVLAGLPPSISEMALQFPAEARDLPFKYLGVDWNPQGHEPDKVYTMPHFDFHFYLQSYEETRAIKPGSCHGLDCAVYERAVQEVPAQYAPRGYRNVGAVVPLMGNHLIDPTAPEFNNQPFTRTFLYGTFDGKLSFYEPMLTLQYLQSRPDEYLDLKLPEAYAQSGYYPTRYSVRYDPSNQVYRISLERFVYRQAQ